MHKTINAKELRASLPKIVESVKRGGSYTVLYRSRPAFRIVPIDETERITIPLSEDPLYQSAPVGETSDEYTSADHDEILYGNGRK